MTHKKVGRKEFSSQILSMMSPTIILHQGWETECPKWILEKIKTERMIEVMKQNASRFASDWEALAYLQRVTTD